MYITVWFRSCKKHHGDVYNFSNKNKSKNIFTKFGWTLRNFCETIPRIMYIRGSIYPKALTLWDYHNCMVNSLRPGDAIWHHKTGSTLVQVMAWCLMAPSHYLSQCWLIINGGPVAITSGQFHGKWLTFYWLKCLKITFKLQPWVPGADELTQLMSDFL